MIDRFGKKESISYRPWISSSSPRKILVIRFHALGDVSITFPFSNDLRSHFPDAEIDFLTTTLSSPLAEALDLFNNILTIEIASNRAGRVFQSLIQGNELRSAGYDIINELQRNWMSRMIRRIASPSAWAEFDRFSMHSAHDRVHKTFQLAGFKWLQPNYQLPIKKDLCEQSRMRLIAEGWNGFDPLIILNPAGLWQTRNWELEKYVELARLFLSNHPAQFLLLGTERIEQRALYIKRKLGDHAIDLVGRTTLQEAFAAIQHAALMVSEDSGLMHMACSSGIPTIALFGSTRHVWSAPQGRHSRMIHSGDLECGSCMSETCRFGDVHCFTRIRAQRVYELGQEIFHHREILVHA